MLQVYATRAHLGHRFRRAARAQVPRLIAPDVKGLGAKGREEVRVEVPEEGVRRLIEGTEGPTRCGLGQVFVLRQVQGVGAMAEGLQIRHQLNLTLPRVGIEFQDVVAVKRTAAQSDAWMMRKNEGVLGIELEHVDLVEAELINQEPERFESRHFAARYV